MSEIIRKYIEQLHKLLQSVDSVLKETHISGSEHEILSSLSEAGSILEDIQERILEPEEGYTDGD